jgi:hypothetical protein
MSRYRPISREVFAAVMADMGFTEVAYPGSMEHIYQRAIARRDGTSSRFTVRIFSSVHKESGWTRECGDDAIRIVLFDTALQDDRGRERIVQDWRTFRTENALSNLRERARDAFRYALANACECGALMVERKGKTGPFMGCTDFPNCKRTRSLVCEPVRRAA